MASLWDAYLILIQDINLITKLPGYNFGFPVGVMLGFLTTATIYIVMRDIKRARICKCKKWRIRGSAKVFLNDEYCGVAHDIVLREGHVKKGGVNQPPSIAKPKIKIYG